MSKSVVLIEPAELIVTRQLAIFLSHDQHPNSAIRNDALFKLISCGLENAPYIQVTQGDLLTHQGRM